MTKDSLGHYVVGRLSGAGAQDFIKHYDRLAEGVNLSADFIEKAKNSYSKTKNPFLEQIAMKL